MPRPAQNRSAPTEPARIQRDLRMSCPWARVVPCFIRPDRPLRVPPAPILRIGHLAGAVRWVRLSLQPIHHIGPSWPDSVALTGPNPLYERRPGGVWEVP